MENDKIRIRIEIDNNIFNFLEKMKKKYNLTIDEIINDMLVDGIVKEQYEQEEVIERIKGENNMKKKEEIKETIEISLDTFLQLTSVKTFLNTKRYDADLKDLTDDEVINFCLRIVKNINEVKF